MSTSVSPAFAAADWGTSNMRVWLLGGDGEVLGERRSNDGMLTAAGKGYAAILDGHLEAMGAPAGLPVVVCGMAGARQGWTEAGYINVPARIADLASNATKSPGTAREVRILPGLSQAAPLPPDVMRGEETQLAGAGLAASGRHLVCMPGTHSKWVGVEDGVVIGFRTAMTGELFAVLSAHSILRHSVGEKAERADPQSPAFAQWLGLALDNPADLTSLFFRIRAAGLLENLPANEAVSALSGLLLGSEIAGARSGIAAGAKVILVGSGSLGDLYRTALGLAGIEVEQVDADAAVRAGLFAAGRKLFLEGSAA